MTSTPNAYCATVAYADARGQYEQQTTLHFSAADDRAACLGVQRWFRNRSENLPEHFTTLLAVSVYRFTLPTFQDDGFLPSNTGFALFEWKCDWFPSMPYEDYVAEKVR